MPPDYSAPMPHYNTPLAGADGRTMNEVWFRLIWTLIRRTGGEPGGGIQLSVAEILGLEADIPLPFDAAHQIVELSLGLQQAFAAIAALQLSIPAFGEVFGDAGQVAVLPDVCGALSAQAPLTEMTFART